MLNSFYINQCSSSNSPEAMCYFYFSLSGKELQIIVKVSISRFYLCGSQQIHIDLLKILWPFSFTVLTFGIIFALKLSLSYILTLSLKLRFVDGIFIYPWLLSKSQMVTSCVGRRNKSVLGKGIKLNKLPTNIWG